MVLSCIEVDSEVDPQLDGKKVVLLDLQVAFGFEIVTPKDVWVMRIASLNIRPFHVNTTGTSHFFFRVVFLLQKRNDIVEISSQEPEKGRRPSIPC